MKTCGSQFHPQTCPPVLITEQVIGTLTPGHAARMDAAPGAPPAAWPVSSGRWVCSGQVRMKREVEQLQHYEER